MRASRWKTAGAGVLVDVLVAAAGVAAFLLAPRRVTPATLAEEYGRENGYQMWEAHELLRHRRTPMDTAQGLLIRANVYADVGRPQDALRDYRASAEAAPRWYGPERTSGVTVAERLANRGDYPEAVEVFEDLVRRFPGDSPVLRSYGLFLSRTKNPELRDTARAVAMLKAAGAEKRIVARALAADGQLEEAIALLEKELLPSKRTTFPPGTDPRSANEMKRSYRGWIELLEREIEALKRGEVPPPSRDY